MQTLARRDAVAIIMGIVIGAGIYRTPSLVAANLSGDWAILAVWVAGAALSLAGALCYAELASAFPETGGEYHYLRRAFGVRLAVLYGWSRLLIIQTGSVALLAYVYGDYASRLVDLGPYSATMHAALAVIFLTAVQWSGMQFGTGVQRWLTFLELAGLGVLVIAALWAEPAASVPPAATGQNSALGLALVFVLLTYGGWNEAAYLSAELKGPPGRIGQILVISLSLIALAYLAVNMALLRALGAHGLARSTAPAADLLHMVWGQAAGVLISFMVAIAALASAHGTILTGARSVHALGRDVTPFGIVGRWEQARNAPANALLLQGVLALVLVVAGGWARDGFQLAVEYTAPAFWFFFLAVGVSLFVFRVQLPEIERPFRVPFYPVLPALFCLSSAFLLYSSVAFTGIGALVSLAVSASGALLFPFLKTHDNVKKP